MGWFNGQQNGYEQQGYSHQGYMQQRFNQQGYNANMMPQDSLLPRVTKSEVVSIIQGNVMQSTGISPQRVIKIQDAPDTLRHACVQCGIVHLPKYSMSIPAQQGMLTPSFYFCSSCCSLYVVDDYMY